MNKIRYLSLFSGIEAFSQAVEDLNFEPVGFAEIEPFACEVLKIRYPDVKNYGDVSKIDGTALKGKVDLIVGGSPCQDFSQAGGRLGLEGERSSLAIEYIRLLNEIQPYAFIWENVPGCTSTNNGNDLRMLLEAFQDVGYVLDADILDSQFFGIPQRRRRIFVCGLHLEEMLKRKTASAAIVGAKCLLACMGGALADLKPLRSRPQAEVSVGQLGMKTRKRLGFLFRDPRLLADALYPWGGIPLKTKLFPAASLFDAAATLGHNAMLAMNVLGSAAAACPSMCGESDFEPAKEFVEHARWTGSSLLGDVGRADFWIDFIRQARLQEEAFRDTGADRECARPILFEFQGMPGYSPQSGEARQNNTGRSQEGARNSGISGTLCASGAGLDRPSAQGNQLDYLVQDVPAYAVRTAQTGANGIGIGIEMAHTMDAHTPEAVVVEREREREL